MTPSNLEETSRIILTADQLFASLKLFVRKVLEEFPQIQPLELRARIDSHVSTFFNGALNREDCFRVMAWAVAEFPDGREQLLKVAKKVNKGFEELNVELHQVAASHATRLQYLDVDVLEQLQWYYQIQGQASNYWRAVKLGQLQVAEVLFDYFATLPQR